MPHIDRFSVSLDTELLAAFDRHIACKRYENRSEAIRDMIRDLLIASRLQSGDEEVAALLTVACEQRTGEAATRLRSIITSHPDLVYGSLHLPINRDRERVVISLRGPVDRVQTLANEIQALRGITHGHLSAVPTKE
ncbi:MAG: nickel-responsive transcriptional regulator NikR [Planctomycetota bacterium]|jgi:CopG family nickel-responsive transcriptional regulator